jgi:ssDNA thymidine ADP-ribosyltransferase, DarT
VDRSRVKELHYITPITNLPSIKLRGILSHNGAAHLDHQSIADESVQDKRVGKRVPGGLLLHDCVNLFFDARNSMMYKRLPHKMSIAVLCVHPAVLDIADTVVTDGNAASPSTTFGPSPGGLAALNEERIFAHSWDHPDEWIRKELKRQRSAEVLVPGAVPTRFLLGGYVYSDAVTAKCNELCPEIEVKVYRHVYFA